MIEWHDFMPSPPVRANPDRQGFDRIIDPFSTPHGIIHHVWDENGRGNPNLGPNADWQFTTFRVRVQEPLTIPMSAAELPEDAKISIYELTYIIHRYTAHRTGERMYSIFCENVIVETGVMPKERS